MSIAPVTLSVARHVAAGRCCDFLAWQHEDEALAVDFPDYLGPRAPAPPVDGGEFQVIFHFVDDATLAVWAHSASRQAWPERGQGPLGEPRERRAHGPAAWSDGDRKPSYWEQSVAIWLVFFPVSLTFSPGAGPYLGELSLAVRVLLSTLILTPSMTYWSILPLNHLFVPWLHRRSRRAASLPEAYRRLAIYPDGVGYSARLCPASSVEYPVFIRLLSLAMRALWRQPRS